MKNIAIIGASGGIGAAFCDYYAKKSDTNVIELSRSSGDIRIDLMDEKSIKDAADEIDVSLDIIIVATGILHSDDVQPEKTMAQLNEAMFLKSLHINTVGPALIAKYFIPKMNTNASPKLLFLSARVGSISDNRLGGWYSYRAGKAALNMLIKTLAIEVGRRHKDAVIAGLHPGTVDTELSAPFSKNVPEHKLFSPDYSVSQMADVIDRLSPDESGRIFDYAGDEVLP